MRVWTVTYAPKASKQRAKMPKSIQDAVDTLVMEMEKEGPWRKNWPHFSSLEGNRFPEETFHCHLKRGRPTYVSCWYVVDKRLKKIEVIYVGTHENAPY